MIEKDSHGNSIMLSAVINYFKHNRKELERRKKNLKSFLKLIFISYFLR